MVSGLQESYKAAIDALSGGCVGGLTNSSKKRLELFSFTVVCKTWQRLTRSIDSNVLEQCFKTLLWMQPCLVLLWGSGSMRVWIHTHRISHKCSSLLIFTLCRAHAGRQGVLGSCVLNVSDKETRTVTCLCGVILFCWKAGEIYDAWNAGWWLFWRIRCVIWKCQVQD